MHSMKTWSAVAALVFSGLVQAVISPPMSLVWLHPVAWVPAFLVFERVRGRRAFLAGWLVGFSANLGIFYWLIHTLTAFTDLPAIAGVAVLVVFAAGVGLYAGIFALGYRAIGRVSGSFRIVGLATWFVACEFVNPQLFPYYQGVAWYRHSSVFLVVSLTGVAGMTMIVMLANGVLAAALNRREERRQLAVGAVALAVMIGVAAAWSAHREAAITEAEASARTIRVALIQSDNDVERRTALQALGPQRVPRDLVALSDEALDAHPRVDAVIWPETALMRQPDSVDNAVVIDFVRRRDVELWTGGYAYEGTGPERRCFNSGYRISPDGIDVRYDKMIRVPFGEYVPFADWIPFLDDVHDSRAANDLTPGRSVRVYESSLARFSFLICYEAIHPSFVRRSVRLRPDLLVNLTYDGWYGDTSEPSQHLMLTAIQAAQFGIPVARCTTTGVSTVIDARGRIGEATRLDSRCALVADVRPVHVPSPYGAWGDWLAWIAVIVSVAALLRARMTRS